MQERGLSVNQLHKMTGISRTTLDPLVNSEELPSKTRIETLERICSSLNIFFDELVEVDYKYNVVDCFFINKNLDFINFKEEPFLEALAGNKEELEQFVSMDIVCYCLIEIKNKTSTKTLPIKVTWTMPEFYININLKVDYSIFKDSKEFEHYNRFDVFVEKLSPIGLSKAVGYFLSRHIKNMKKMSDILIQYAFGNDKNLLEYEDMINATRLKNYYVIMYDIEGITDYIDRYDIEVSPEFQYKYAVDTNTIDFYTRPKISFEY